MFERLHSLLVVIEEGGVNRAARRLGVSQPTLTRHIQSLEQELGGTLFERGARGMRPTALGFFVRDTFAPVVRQYEAARAEAFAFAQGRHRQLRVGYIGLAAARFLNPALVQLRREFPDLRAVPFDLTPREQLERLRGGAIDVALVGQEVGGQGDDFFQRTVAKLGVCAVLPVDHPLAAVGSLRLADLRSERFVGVAETAVPGRNDWVAGVCRRAGFRPRFVAVTEDIQETFAHIAAGGGLALLPDYLSLPPPAGLAYVRVADSGARWSLLALRQRGRAAPAAVRLVELMAQGGR